jgi:thiamine-phosphate pyrophosphorylase
LHAITDRAVLELDDLGVRAAALASTGSVVALHARDRTATGEKLTATVRRFLSLAQPPEAAVFVNARPDIAAALGAQGVQLGAGDLLPGDARLVAPSWSGWIGSSVHSTEEARAALEAGADFLMVGPIYRTATHPGRPAAGPGLVSEVASLGRPVIAIGGVTPERSQQLREAGAYGIAAITAAWHVRDPAAAALALLAPWLEAA